jgi:hypothetical protein
VRSVVILVYERVAEVEEGTASVAFDVLNVFVGHVELCVIVQSNFVVWLAQVMQRLRNPRLMCQKIGVHFNDANLLCDPCFNITLADEQKWGWSERQEATTLSLVHSFWPEDQTTEHTLLDCGEVELATIFFS